MSQYNRFETLPRDLVQCCICCFQTKPGKLVPAAWWVWNDETLNNYPYGARLCDDCKKRHEDDLLDLCMEVSNAAGART